MAWFMMKLIPPRATFLSDATPAETQAMGRHASDIRVLIGVGELLAAGPVNDPSGAWGFAVADAPDAPTAMSWGQAHPVGLSNIGFRRDVFPILSLLLPET
ncbi:MAG: YciI family protein [Hyphomonas sp.]|uniref:YciI family protein n=1 Tax=Hyphomonas sp. TaxID=87 RepID=UPI0034A01010